MPTQYARGVARLVSQRATGGLWPPAYASLLEVEACLLIYLIVYNPSPLFDQDLKGAQLKRFLYALGAIAAAALALGGYFLFEYYRPFEARITPPAHLEQRYSGPGALPIEPAQNDSQTQSNTQSTSS